MVFKLNFLTCKIKFSSNIIKLSETRTMLNEVKMAIELLLP